MSKSSQDIRRDFLQFFRDRQHVLVPSSPLLLPDDPTLLFANAGMNQFKPYFLGTDTPEHPRVANSQKCIRAGGKHNDLEDVGRDCYHHTFFEMLGNWSFGDYFKTEAIQWAWELLVDVWGLDPNRLYVTVFAGDEKDGLEADTETEEIWKNQTAIDPSHIQRWGREDNFWEMGDTGPCGPCSEVHYDLTPDASGAGKVNRGDPQVIEIWNLVFIQYNRTEDGALHRLPAQHVDTGMGFERICKVLQGKQSNYAIDLWQPIFQAIEQKTAHRYGTTSGLADRFDTLDENDLGDVACRVIADHIRTLSFAIADGILPSNEGRGSVLRSILRRASGFGRQYLHIKGLFLHDLVPAVVESLGDVFPELRDRQAVIEQTIREEEESFSRTLDRGLGLFDEKVAELRTAGGKTISGATAFELHATYGFPFTLTKLMAEKKGLDVDEAGFDRAMEEHRATSAAGGGTFRAESIIGLPETDDSSKYTRKQCKATLLGWVQQGQYITEGTLAAGEEASLVLDSTCLYGESGGQVGDSGTIRARGVVFDVHRTIQAGACVLHEGVLRKGELSAGVAVTARYDANRRMAIMRNHTATHLLNWALRRELGEGCDQAGSEVGPDRLRFDFTHGQGLSAEQLRRIEHLVNQRVLADQPIRATVMPLAEAREIPGVRAVFGERYPDPVRVVTMGAPRNLSRSNPAQCNVEFCGGTHLSRTSQVGLVKILAEESVAKGVRRISAVTGEAALEWVQRTDKIVSEAAGLLRAPAEEVPARITSMQKEIRELRKAPPAGKAEIQDETILELAGGRVVVGQCASADAKAMRGLCDSQRQKGASAVFLGGTDGSKVILIAMVTDEWANKGLLRAGDWVKEIAPVVGGGGGGKPTMAQAGGKDPARLPEALETAASWAREKLSGESPATGG